MDWKLTLINAGLPCEWAEENPESGQVGAGFSRPLTAVEWQKYLDMTAPQQAAENRAVTDYGTLAEWAKTGTAADAETYINAQVWSGQTQAQVNAWIDANVTGTTIATLRAQVVTALKLEAGAIIAMRGLFVLVAKLLLYIRDLVIRFRS